MMIMRAHFVVFVCVILSINAEFVDKVYNESKEEQKLTANLKEIALEILKKMDQNVDPCDNFYRFTCGNFLNSIVIPDEKDQVNSFTEIFDTIQEQLKIIIEKPSFLGEKKPFQLAKNYYKTCMNETAIDNQGVELLKKILKELGGWPVLEGRNWDPSQFNWIESYVKSQKMGFSMHYFLDIQILNDKKNTSKQILYENHGNPSKERLYLLSENEKIYNAYLNYTIEVAVMLGAKRRLAEKAAMKNRRFLAKINAISRIPNEIQNMTKLYNPMKISELEKNYPTIPWKKYLNQLLSPNIKIDDNEIIIITRPKYIKDLEELIESNNMIVVANYMMWKIVEKAIPFLNENLRNLDLKFQTFINGHYENEPRWKKCIGHVTESFSLSSAALYVRKHFDNDARKNALELVTNIRNQYIKIISNSSWMDDETKKHALGKIEYMSIHIGYFDELLDDSKLEEVYKDLELSEKSFLEQNLMTTVFQNNNAIKKLRMPVNKKDWATHDSSTDVNAYYIPTENNIQLPAGVLQGSLFNKDRPRYMNYGTIGYFIGHEITHGFDNNGRQYNKDGNLVNWWSPLTEESFNKKAQCFVEQYGNYRLKGLKTTSSKYKNLGENIADNGGIQVAYMAYLDWVNKNGPEEKLPNLKWSPRQLFWINAASLWCTGHRPEHFMSHSEMDNHSPSELRILGPFSNMPEFAQDFNCSLGSKMNPVKKCSIW